MPDHHSENGSTDQGPRVLSVNAGSIRRIEGRGVHGTSAIWKAPVAGRIAVRRLGLDGDAQADLRVHGGPDKAVYAYAVEDLAWWGERLGRHLAPGTFGENLTLEGVAVTDALIGERWAVGTTVLEVSQPREPCWKLGVRMVDPRFPRAFAAAGRPGAYLRVVEEGELGAGDAVRIIHRPNHGVTIGLIALA